MSIQARKKVFAFFLILDIHALVLTVALDKTHTLARSYNQSDKRSEQLDGHFFYTDSKE
jgi:hypothetical protein